MAVDWKSPLIVERVRRGALRGLVQGIGIVERRALYLIQQTAKTGRKYRRRGVVHQASGPGEPPASDTGTLVKRRSVSIDAGALRARLSFHARHAWFLERGTRKMAPRPFARRALMETRAEVAAAIAAEVTAELRKP